MVIDSLHPGQNGAIHNINDVAPTICAGEGVKTQTKIAVPLTCNYRIRKFTPRECFRLMGVAESDIDTICSAGISNSQLYKLAGNSIVVNCLAAIFRQLFIENGNKVQQLEIF